MGISALSLLGGMAPPVAMLETIAASVPCSLCALDVLDERAAAMASGDPDAVGTIGEPDRFDVIVFGTPVCRRHARGLLARIR